MKLGGYGCLRMAALMPDAAHSYSWIIILLATIAIIYCALHCDERTSLLKKPFSDSTTWVGLLLLFTNWNGGL
jgi:NADH-quinone oxidoreductase subunit M